MSNAEATERLQDAEGAGAVKRQKHADTATTGARKTSASIRTMAQIAMLGAVSVILMLIEFPLPFLAPPFYQLDFSEVPVLIGTFAMGPLAGAAIELIKILLNLVINGTITAGVGELANFIIGCSMILPAGIIYRKHKTRKRAITGMVTGTVIMAVIGCFINAFVLLPAYSVGLGISMDALVGMGTAINPAITNVGWFVVLAVAPFNLVKGIVVSVVTMLLYKRVSVIIKGNHR